MKTCRWMGRLGWLVVWPALTLWAAREDLGLTRLTIEVSGGSPDVTEHLAPDPPTIIVEVHSPGATTPLESGVTFDSGIVRALRATCVPAAKGHGPCAVQQLAVELRQPESYRVMAQPHGVLIEIDTPPSLLPDFATGAGFTIRGFDADAALLSRLTAMDQVLQEIAPPVVPIPPMPRPMIVLQPVPFHVSAAAMPSPAGAPPVPDDFSWGWAVLAGVGAAAAGILVWLFSRERAARHALTRRLEALAPTTAWQARDRRRWARRDLDERPTRTGVPVSLLFAGGDACAGIVLNISEGGLCVECPADDRLPDELILRLCLPNRRRPIETIGRCVWRSGGADRRRMGLVWSSLTPEDRFELAAFVEEGRERAGLHERSAV